MSKIFLAVLFLFLAPSLSFPQQPLTTRTLAAEQLFQYGQAVYDRGDYSQAAQIFSRVLVLSPNHPEALGYVKNLKKKGQVVIVPERTGVVYPPSVKEIIPKPQPTRSKKIAETPSQEPTPIASRTTSSGDNQDLKQSIQEADAAIEKLKSDIADLRNQTVLGKK
jgi:TolA-binding protein